MRVSKSSRPRRLTMTNRSGSGRFFAIAAAMADSEEKIVEELNATQGPAQDVGGYYKPDFDQATAAMCPSETLNGIIGCVLGLMGVVDVV